VSPLLRQLRQILRRHPRAVSLLFISLLATGFFTLRALDEMRDLAPHDSHPLASWMTPRYIVKSHDVPPELLRGVFGDQPMELKRMPLHRIARHLDVPLPDLVAELEAAIVDWRRANTGDVPETSTGSRRGSP
jgi:hypothetical protein